MDITERLRMLLAVMYASGAISTGQVVDAWADHYGVNRDLARCIVEHESGWDPAAVGDQGHAVGLWQWHLPSWQYVRRRMGRPLGDERADVVESTEAAMYAIGELGLLRWWSARRLCPQAVEASTEEAPVWRDDG